ncbi:K Homology domain-containing protein [Artemisia annua]|uniref:K Homology domain-containing protein n=1 Tax=Artemisia annua TaxID=35608 RepID=A0A2U1PYH0_ARTAN|nr:K Homology domain-containing protein [Artemisia annua]
MKTVRTICRDYGVVCIRREGQDIEEIIARDEILTENKGNIEVVDEIVPNRISSTLVRDCISRGLSVKYLTSDESLVELHLLDSKFISGRTDYGQKPYPTPMWVSSAYGYGNPSKKIDIPNGRVGVIIGKGGETIKYLQLQFGAKIQVTGEMVADPNTQIRGVELTVSSESIAKAEELIRDVLAEVEAGGSGVEQFSILDASAKQQDASSDQIEAPKQLDNEVISELCIFTQGYHACAWFQ